MVTNTLTVVCRTKFPLAQAPFLVIGLLVAFAVDVIEHAPQAVEPDDRVDYLQILTTGE
jgi:hypothetical protein